MKKAKGKKLRLVFIQIFLFFVKKSQHKYLGPKNGFSQKVHIKCSVPAEITHKSCSVSAEIPHKKCSVRPRYHIYFVLYCSFLFSIFFIMAKHLVLTQHSPPFLPPNLQTLTLRWYNSTLSHTREWGEMRGNMRGE